MNDPLDGATVLARWKFVFDEPDERGGGFVMGEFLLRDDGALLRRMGGSSTGSDGSGGYDRSWRFGPWSTVPYRDGAADADRAAAAIRQWGYDLRPPDPVPIDHDTFGPVPVAREP